MSFPHQNVTHLQMASNSSDHTPQHTRYVALLPVTFPLSHTHEKTNIPTLPVCEPKMPSILVLVFVLQLAIHLVNTVGASTVNSIVRPSLLEFPSQQTHTHTPLPSYMSSTAISNVRNSYGISTTDYQPPPRKQPRNSAC